MRKLIFATSLSLDGYIEEGSCGSSWVVPDEELHRHFNSLEQDIDTHLYGRRMYELMAADRPTADQNPSMLPYELDYAHHWLAAQKVVFSKTLESVGWNARIVSGDACEEVAQAEVSPRQEPQCRRPHPGLSPGYSRPYRRIPILLRASPAGLWKSCVRLSLVSGVNLQLLETRAFKSGTVLNPNASRSRCRRSSFHFTNKAVQSIAPARCR